MDLKRFGIEMPQPGAESTVAVVRDRDIETIADLIDQKLQEKGIFNFGREECLRLACDVLQAVFDIDQIMALEGSAVAELLKQ